MEVHNELSITYFPDFSTNYLAYHMYVNYLILKKKKNIFETNEKKSNQALLSRSCSSCNLILSPVS